MTLSSSISIIRSATIVAGLLTLISLIFYFMAFRNFTYLMVYFAIMLITLLIALGKRIWVRYLLRNTQYPGLLYEVCNSLELLRNINVNPSDEVLDDLYQPAYATEDFLKDNKLKTEIYPVMPLFPILGGLLFYGFPLVYILWLSGAHVTNKSYYLLVPFLYAAGFMLSNKLKLRKDPSAGPQYIFAPEGLSVAEGLIEWTNLYDWEYIRPRGRGAVPLIGLRANEAVNGQIEFTVKINDLAISLTDFFLLLTHYKYKYGYNPNYK